MASSWFRGRRRRASSIPAARVAREEVNRARLTAGELGLDIYNMRPTLAQRGLAYIDGPVEWTDPDFGE